MEPLRSFRFLELGPEFNKKTKKAKHSDAWFTMGLSEKTKVDLSGDIDKGLPLPDCRFEVVYASHVLEHLKDPVGTLKECFRVLIPGGWCRMSVPSAKWLIQQYLDGKSGIDNLVEQFRSVEPRKHRWAFDETSLSVVFSLAGFEGVNITGVNRTSIHECMDRYFHNRLDRSIFCEGRKPK